MTGAPQRRSSARGRIIRDIAVATMSAASAIVAGCAGSSAPVPVDGAANPTSHVDAATDDSGGPSPYRTCDESAGPCPAGFICLHYDHECGICVSAAQEGEPCSDCATPGARCRPCDHGLACVGQTPVCQRIVIVPVGGACGTDDRPCTDDAFCHDGACVAYGTLAVGSSCLGTDECASGLYCAGDNKCAPLLHDGDDCGGPGRDACGPGLFCGGSTGTTCTRKLSNGADCRSSGADGCQSGYCRPCLASDGFCCADPAVKDDVGAPCESSANCKAGLFCWGVCQTQLALGDSCDGAPSDACPAATPCDLHTHRCVAPHPVGLGELCSDAFTCNAGQCIGSFCKVVVPFGGACDDHSACEMGACSEGVCQWVACYP
jgi:hypothetical protein